MKTGWSRPAVLAAIGLLILAPVVSGEKSPERTLVDSGSFGVYNDGHRVATEKFSIKQTPEGSVISSEFKSAQGELTADQSSELQLTVGGELRRYEWKELQPDKNEATVVPSDEFLVEKFSQGNKQQSQNFLLPPTTAVLDDYFFVQREVLAWRYLAMACKHDKGPVSCPMKQPVHFGAIDPHARNSFSVSIEFAGRDTLTFKGAQGEFSHFILKSEAGDWAFWLDNQLKLVRLVSDRGTEVLRD